LLPLSQQEIRMSDRFEAIIPPEDRRRVWQKLQQAGFNLPELTAPPSDFPMLTEFRCLFFLGMLLVLGPPLLLLAFLGKLVRSSMLKRFQGSFFDRIFPRVPPENPLAVNPPIGCETIQEAVLQLTRFKVEDYKAGLWPSELIGARVRQIIAASSGVPFQAIKSETRFIDLDPARLR